MAKSVYLAGPDVFYRDAVVLGRQKQEICARYGLVGLFPLDNEVSIEGDPAQARMEIYRGNLEMMRKADVFAVNAAPFKGLDADPGTAFEVGYAAALRRPIYLYSAFDETLAARHAAAVDELSQSGAHVADCFRFEDFGVEELESRVNLMLHEACVESGGALLLGRSRKAEDLAIFEEVVKRICADLAEQNA